MAGRVTEFLDNLDDKYPSAVWALIDLLGSGLVFIIAWGAFADGQRVIALVAALAGLYLFAVALYRLYREFRGGVSS